MKPLILINFKSYKEGTGRKGRELARAVNKFKSGKYQLAVCPQLVDLKEIYRAVKIPVFAQHVDGIGFGAHTGWVLPEAVKRAGAKGTLINHSERKVEAHLIKEVVERCKEVGLKAVVCAGSLKGVKKVARFEPDYIAYEPPGLIGKDVSVTSANPKVILKAVKAVKAGEAAKAAKGKGAKLLVGAGVHSREDIQKALELGAAGVLIAHKVVKAKNKEKVLKELFT